MELFESINELSKIGILAKAIAREVVKELAALNAAPIVVEAEPPRAIVRIGSLVVDSLRHEVTANGRLIELKTQEFALLLALARGAGRAFSRAQLLDIAWSCDASPSERTVDVHIRRLRTKLGPDAKLLQTISRVGYKLDDRV
jgi:DNA-binding response OmpR family regulator